MVIDFSRGCMRERKDFTARTGKAKPINSAFDIPSIRLLQFFEPLQESV